MAVAELAETPDESIEDRRKIQVALGRLDFFLADARESMLVESQERCLEKINGLLKLTQLLHGRVSGNQLPKVLAVREAAGLLMGEACLLHSALAEAEVAFSESYDDLSKREATSEQRVVPVLGLVEVSLAQDRLKDAQKHLDRARRFDMAKDDLTHQSKLKVLEGEILLKAGQLKEAHASLEEAVRIMQKAKLNLPTALTQLHLFSALTRISLAFKDTVRAKRWLAHAFTWVEKVATSKQLVKPSSRLELWFRTQGLTELMEGVEQKQRGREVALALSEVLFLKGRWERSLDYAKAAEDGLAFDHAHARAMLTKARCLGNMRQYKEALSCVASALEWAAKERATSLSANGYLEKGVLLMRQGHDDEGVTCLSEARSQAGLLDRFHGVPLVVRTRNQEAFLQIKQNSPKKALEILDDAKQMLSMLPLTQANAECLKFQGHCQTELRDFLKAERNLLESLGMYQDLEMTHDVAQVFKQLGLNAIQKAALEEGHYYLDESIEILQKLDMVSEIPLLYTQKGKLAILQEDYQEAERIFKEEMAASRRAANAHMLAFSHYHLGQLFRIQKRHLLAEKLLIEASSLFRKVDNKRYLGLTDLELANLFTDQQKTMRALEYLAQAEPLLKGQHNPFILAKFYMVKAHVLTEVKNKQGEARNWYRMALQIYEQQPTATLELAEAYHEMAQLSRRRKDMGQCITFYRKAINTSEMLGFGQKTARWLEELQRISPENASKIKLQSLAGGEQVVERMEREGDTGMMQVTKATLSIYFVDIRGFTSTTEKLTLDEMTSFLNDFYLNMSNVVMRNKGMINKFIGDNIMALYNVSGDLPDHPVWAVRTGLEMQSEIAKINQRREKRGEVPIKLGIGVNTGEVLLGSFGSVLRQDFTAIGDAVNTAARLQAAAKPGETIVSDATWQLIKAQFDAQNLGEVQVKGKAQPVRMWKVLREKD